MIAIVPAGGAFPGDTEIARRLRAVDWAGTSLGPVEHWPATLREATSLMLSSGFPMLLAWGPDLAQIYNDGYARILGSKHPAALGAPASTTWSEVWEGIEPLVDCAIAAGEPVFRENELVPLDRGSGPEEAYFTFSYGPLRDEDGAVRGLLSVAVETTEQVVGLRRNHLIRQVAGLTPGERVVEERVVEEMARRIVALCDHEPRDLPFSAIYLKAAEAGLWRRAAASPGVEPELPVELRSGAPEANEWGLGALLRAQRTVMSEPLARPPASGWPEPVRCAALVPAREGGREEPETLLLAGLSPRLALDEPYRAFLARLARQISSSLAVVRSRARERAAARELREAVIAGERLLSVVSHDLRTPLNTLAIMAELLGRAGLPEEKHAQYVATVRGAIAQMTAILDELVAQRRRIELPDDARSGPSGAGGDPDPAE